MTFTKLSFLGGEGVDGGQGNSDYLYGSGDDSERYGISSGMSDSNSADMATGSLQVRLMNPTHVQPVVWPPGIFCTNQQCLPRASGEAAQPMPLLPDPESCPRPGEEIFTCLDLQCPDGPAEPGQQMRALPQQWPFSLPLFVLYSLSARHPTCLSTRRASSVKHRPEDCHGDCTRPEILDR